MTKKQYENVTGIFSTQLAIGSFIIGTILLILHLINPTGALFGVGVIYLILAFTINLIMLLRLTYLAFKQKNHQDYFTVKILILLSNIPIAFVYLRIVGKTWN
jgi:hypothetical protein